MDQTEYTTSEDRDQPFRHWLLPIAIGIILCLVAQQPSFQ